MADDSTTPIPLGLTPEQLACFERDGFVGPFTALGPEEMAERYPIFLKALLHPSPVYGFRTVRDHHLSCRALFEVCSHPAIVNVWPRSWAPTSCSGGAASSGSCPEPPA